MAQTMPDFLIIGAPKSGTTSLYHYLAQHPQIFMSPNKEPHFFAFEGEQPNFCGSGDDKAWINTRSVVTLAEYQQLFSAAEPGQKCGEASTMYLYLEKSCDRIFHHIPNVKLIAFLRHPVDRAYSHYKHLRRDGREWESDFGRAMQEEAERIQQNWSPAWHYQQIGLYSEQIKRYQRRFNPEQLQIYLYDDLLKNPQAVYRSIFEFIGVDAAIDIDVSKRHNTTTAVRKHKLLHDFLVKPNGLKNILRQVIPAQIRQPLSAKVYRKNATAIPALSTSQRAELTGLFESDILQLQDLIDRDLSCWLSPLSRQGDGSNQADSSNQGDGTNQVDRSEGWAA
ncbi:MAG: sulfotransferase [Cyanobacteria bacterium J06623_5]